MSDVNMRLPDVSFELLERQNVVDFGFVAVDGRLERPGCRGRDDDVRLLEPVQELVEPAVSLLREREPCAGDAALQPPLT